MTPTRPHLHRRRGAAKARRGAAMAAAIAATVTAAACAEPAPVVTLVGGSPGGAWAAVGEALSEQLRQALPGRTVTLEPGQDGANALVLGSGQVELAIVNAAVARAAIAGEPPFPAPVPGLRAITLLYGQSAFQFIVDRRAGVRRFEDVAARRVPLRISVNTRGSLMELATRAVLEAYGVGYDSIRAFGGTIEHSTFTAAYDAMRRGRLDAVAATVPVPSSHALEASRSLSLALLPVRPDVVARVNAQLGTEPMVVPGGTYSFAPGDAATFGGRVILATHEGVADSLVYAITDAVYARLPALRRAHRSLRTLTRATMPDVGGVPLHPGAARWYRDHLPP